ncbi:MAG: hypothetical protein KBC38_00775 [Candidatus Pacebacteria bacterium]|nr:hypothetical protein [Candidatus Paceibacterota bacterium]MBP9840530.1 hypothetical protein [Candidatus Paceibacterota bacterium]
METAVTSCEWDSALFLIFSPNVEPFIYYSHLLPLITSLLLGGYVLWSGRRSLISWVLAFIALMFAAWVYFDLILWASPSPEHVMFFWSIIVPVEMLIYAGCLYLIYLFSNRGNDISLGRKIAITVFFIPIVLLLHTSYNVLGLSYDCDTGAIEGPLIQYMYAVEVLYIVWAALVITRGIYRLKTRDERLQLGLVGLGTILFLISFTAGNITLIFSVGADWEQYKLFGMPIFAAFITYCLIRFKTFDTKVLTSEALIVALGIANVSLLFLQTLRNVRIVAALTFILVCGLGYVLIRNVRREVEQRQEIEKLAVNLANANDRLKELDQMKSEFLSVATHQLRAPLTAMRGYASLIAEGNYGEVREEFKDPLFKITESGRNMANSIEDYLNVSRIEQGRMKFERGEFDISALAKTVVDELSTVASRKGLALALKPCGPLTVMGDVGKIKQVITNYIDNAIKYSPTGTIEVSVEKVEGNARVTVSDTGTGIAADEIPKLFSKFTRARDANKVNTTGTGLGLYVVRQLVEGHKGKAWAESDGLGKGSRFIFEIPA